MRKNSAMEIHERVSMAVAQVVKLVGPVNQTNAPLIRKIAHQLLGIGPCAHNPATRSIKPER
jgi:hypothetical protein